MKTDVQLTEEQRRIVDAIPTTDDFFTRHFDSPVAILDGAVYVANHVVLFSWPTNVPADVNNKLARNCHEIIKDADRHGMPDTAWPQVEPEMEQVTCDKCEGSGFSRETCGKCGGNGYGECTHCGSEIDCDNCKGDGDVKSKTKCEACRGLGDVMKPMPVAIGHRHVAGVYHNIIRTMPGVRFSDAGAANQPIPFSWDGGRGVVMPVSVGATP